MSNRKFFIPSLFLIFTLSAPAQRIPPKGPAFYEGPKRSTERSAISVTPGRTAKLQSPGELTLERLAEVDLTSLPHEPMKTGVHRTVPGNVRDAGTWDQLPDGTYVWRLAIRSPGSRAIRVHFSDFAVGPGRVWVYAPEQTGEEAGPYSGRGIYDDGEFWSGTVFSESAVIEYVPEPGRGPEANLPFTIQAISHQAIEPRQALRVLNNPALRPRLMGSCQLDANCYQEWQDSMRMVAHMVFERDGNQYVCSGTLVNTRNNSFKPYFLTAGHCISDPSAARTLETHWSYQTETCNGAAPQRPRLQSEVGAQLLASSSITEGDYSLLLLRGIPAGLWFAGWDANDPAVGAPLAGIHHPRGSWKRIFFGKRIPDSAQPVSIDGYSASPDLYYHVEMSQGRVEPGSSGSPLFTGPGVLAGILSYAQVSPSGDACDLGALIAGYGRFSVAYRALQPFLEDYPAAAIRLSTNELRFTSNNHSVPGPAKVAILTDSSDSVRFTAVADAGWIRLSHASGEASASLPGSVEISIDPQRIPRAGTYVSTVTFQSSTAPGQLLAVRATVSHDRSRVVLSVSPDPVYEQTPDVGGFRWFYRIQLEETAGVETRITMFRIDGADLSTEIPLWFGSDRVSGGGSLSTGVKARYVNAPAEQYIELAGVDAVSNQFWSRTYTLRLLPAR
jgi:hypothetical protein